jgi:hypothetical protein
MYILYKITDTELYFLEMIYALLFEEEMFKGGLSTGCAGCNTPEGD